MHVYVGPVPLHSQQARVGLPASGRQLYSVAIGFISTLRSEDSKVHAGGGDLRVAPVDDRHAVPASDVEFDVRDIG